MRVGTQNIHRHRHIEGYCNKVPRGHVRVRFWVGNCVGAIFLATCNAILLLVDVKLANTRFHHSLLI